MERKQELQGGGKKATIRAWKTYYTILCGQLVCFFKDEDAFMENSAAAPPIYILNAKCWVASEYRKRENVFKLVAQVTNTNTNLLVHDSEVLAGWFYHFFIFRTVLSICFRPVAKRKCTTGWRKLTFTLSCRLHYS